MRKLIDTLKWEANKKCVALLYATEGTELVETLGDLTLTDGSIAYTASGEIYILDNGTWGKVGQ